MLRIRRTLRRSARDIWIVIDEAPDAPQPVLAVLATAAEARAFVEEAAPLLPHTELAYGPYHVGWTVTGRRYRS